MASLTINVSFDNRSELSDELADQASCYGLPYGIFGLVCWTLFFYSIILTYANCPLCSPCRWGEPYKEQKLSLATFATVLTVGPVVFTCIRCRGEWIMTLMTLGQLTPWSFKIMNDGFRSDQANQATNLIKFYKVFGSVMTVLLSIAGWMNLIWLTIGLLKTEETFKLWIWSIYTAALLAIIAMILLCVADRKRRGDQWEGERGLIITMAYLATTLYMIALHIILAQISGNWGGIAPTGAGLGSAIIFCIGKRLLFLDW
ncbi:10385_t:CDS:2 [Ambispora gerdemannii]|uniref:10385_t:CDS:1 n=1 Tax=Ambispora gerdemannii TaxID=144530 RepID=A0A9N9FPA4_9GLOM|nr:10385_t:CDS:2 [Ambispora gerdemannii]